MAHVLPDEILKYEEWGLPIFPYEENKHPAFAGWQELAVKYAGNRAKHEEWFIEKGYRVGLRTGEVSGLVYIDCDSRDAAVELFKVMPSKIKTIVQTPHGFHFPLRHPGQAIRNAVKTRVCGVLADIRGEGGGIISPPSEIGGAKYRFVDGYGLDPRKLEVFDPSWIDEKPKRWEPVAESDLLHRYARARAWLAHRPSAVSGQGGHKKMFGAACAMFGRFKLTPELAWAAILEYNARAEPPFSEKELRHKLVDAEAKSRVSSEQS